MNTDATGKRRTQRHDEGLRLFLDHKTKLKLGGDGKSSTAKRAASEMTDYEKYESECEEIRQENGLLLDGFEI